MSQAISTATTASVQFRNHRRNHTERILQRAEHLHESDRLVIEQVYARGMSITALARLTRTSPRKLQRRMVKLIRRLDSPIFLYVVRNRYHLPDETRRIAELAICRGQSMRRIATVTGMSLHHVRQQLQSLYAMAGQ